MNTLSKIAVKLIRAYQLNGGGRRYFMVDCNFEPSCSEYTARAIERFGFFSGVYRGFLRVKRCSGRDVTGKIYDPLTE